MSAAACKAAICMNNLAATGETVDRLIGEFSDEQLEEIAACGDKAIKDIVKIATEDRKG